MSPVDTQTELTPASVIDGSSHSKSHRAANSSQRFLRHLTATGPTNCCSSPTSFSKAAKRDIPIDEAIDPLTPKAESWPFFRAIAFCIEQETGALSQVVVDLNHEGFGWALVFAGRLNPRLQTLRDAQRFGFTSLEKMAAEGDKLVSKGIGFGEAVPGKFRISNVWGGQFGESERGREGEREVFSLSV